MTDKKPIHVWMIILTNVDYSVDTCAETLLLPIDTVWGQKIKMKLRDEILSKGSTSEILENVLEAEEWCPSGEPRSYIIPLEHQSKCNPEAFSKGLCPNRMSDDASCSFSRNETPVIIDEIFSIKHRIV